MEGNFAVKKLRKLPHVFNNVLELPFRSDADVTVEETEGFFRFVAEIDLEGAGRGDSSRGNEDCREKGQWRWLLASTMPGLATAAFVDGALVVTVPKGGREAAEFDDGGRGVWGGGGRLVLVQ
ncbi:uncharacterized protein LOC107799129 [Nicotiana tabacum]|uniref:Uncharacterized protein LOC107799129 n=1 Tax=Nicotiana tabacum TaxID=4097 RepID=A0A1S4AM22_TOBAC|nr:PREDICTED: uncharacterized protein LOC107799129 [Nicotiana tabacum]